jgi:hypothetical protein
MQYGLTSGRGYPIERGEHGLTQINHQSSPSRGIARVRIDPRRPRRLDTEMIAVIRQSTESVRETVRNSAYGDQ